jgi:hypothetical protein
MFAFLLPGSWLDENEKRDRFLATLYVIVILAFVLAMVNR